MAERKHNARIMFSYSEGRRLARRLPGRTFPLAAAPDRKRRAGRPRPIMRIIGRAESERLPRLLYLPIGPPAADTRFEGGRGESINAGWGRSGGRTTQWAAARAPRPTLISGHYAGGIPIGTVPRSPRTGQPGAKASSFSVIFILFGGIGS